MAQRFDSAGQGMDESQSNRSYALYTGKLPASGEGQ